MGTRHNVVFMHQEYTYKDDNEKTIRMNEIKFNKRRNE